MDNLESQNDQLINDNTNLNNDKNFKNEKTMKEKNSGSSNTSLILSIVALLVGVAALILYFTGNLGSKNGAGAGDSEFAVKDSVKIYNNLGIAYVNTDSLLLNYKYSIKLNEDLLTEQAKARASMESQYRQFERKYNDFMEKVRLGSFISQSSMESQQQELVNEQARLEQSDADMAQKLMEKQAKLNQELLDTLTNFLGEYNKDERYSMILNGAVILHGNYDMDITNDVVRILNQRYEKSIAGKQ